MREMRDSGVPWIGEVPAGWEVRRVKSIATFSRGLDILKTDLVDDEGTACVSYGEAHGRLKFSFDAENDYIRKAPPQFIEGRERSLVRQGDFIFADTSEDIEGSGDFTCNFGTEPVYAGYHSHIVRLRDKDAIDYRFLAYEFESQPFRVQIQQAVSGVKVYTISVKTIGNAEVLLPPLSEQRRIADWLDERCAAIDAAVEAARASIEEYQAYKKSVISHAVTRGLDPDAPLKDTGIRWIGEIPEHWETVPVKAVTKRRSGHTPDRKIPEYWDGDIVWVSLADSPYLRKHRYISESKNHITLAGIEHSSAEILPSGCVLLSRDATVGLCAITKTELAVSQHFMAYECAPAIYNEYLLDVFYAMNDELIGMSMGSTIPTIGLPLIRKLVTPLPPLPEQHAIADYLDSRTSAIDAVVAQKRAIVEDLLAYKKSLIYEAVTGKREV